MGPFIIGFIIGITLVVLISAMILRAAVALYNSMAGIARTPDAVPTPSFGKAAGITLVTSLANFVAQFGIGFFIGSVAGRGADPEELGRTAQLISIPISLLLMSGLLAAMLPTSFLRGFLVTLLTYVIVFAIAIAIYSVIFMVAR